MKPRASVVLIALMVAGCASVGRPGPPPEPVPSPICHVDEVCGCWVRPPGEPWIKLAACPTPDPTPTPTPTPASCPRGAPVVAKYLFDGGIPRVKPAKPSEVFWTITPKVHDAEFCRPINGALDCPYGAEGDGVRKVCELLHAYPIWEGATPRDGDPFVADSPRGVHVKACHRGLDGKAEPPCIEGFAP